MRLAVRHTIDSLIQSWIELEALTTSTMVLRLRTATNRGIIMYTRDSHELTPGQARELAAELCKRADEIEGKR